MSKRDDEIERLRRELEQKQQENREQGQIRDRPVHGQREPNPDPRPVDIDDLNDDDTE